MTAFHTRCLSKQTDVVQFDNKQKEVNPPLVSQLKLQVNIWNIRWQKCRIFFSGADGEQTRESTGLYSSLGHKHSANDH